MRRKIKFWLYMSVSILLISICLWVIILLFKELQINSVFSVLLDDPEIIGKMWLDNAQTVVWEMPPDVILMRSSATIIVVLLCLFTLKSRDKIKRK